MHQWKEQCKSTVTVDLYIFNDVGQVYCCIGHFVVDLYVLKLSNLE
jgi:hypothetical protein